MQVKIDEKETLEAIESNLRLLQARSNLPELHSAQVNRKKTHSTTVHRVEQKGEKQADGLNFCCA